MNIYKVGKLFVIRGKIQGKFITAQATTAKDAINQIFAQIAIIRSLKAWNK